MIDPTINIMTRLGVALRLQVPCQRSCNNCKNEAVSYVSGGNLEPPDYEWSCIFQDRPDPLTDHLLNAFEDVTGEVNFQFAKVCPHYEKRSDDVASDVPYDEFDHDFFPLEVDF